MKGIYLCAHTAWHRHYDIVYQDINGYRDIPGDCMDVDLTPFDFIIASPPCNYYSRANYSRDVSDYALNTKHLLPDLLCKLTDLGKPFIVENVVNHRLQLDFFEVYNYELGGHRYWSNVKLDLSCVPQEKVNKSKLTSLARQGGFNVYQVVERFLSTIHSDWFDVSNVVAGIYLSDVSDVPDPAARSAEADVPGYPDLAADSKN